MEFFQRNDAYNVFDYLWPNDLLALSSTCSSVRDAVNSYCSIKRIETSSSSAANDYPAVCHYMRHWLRHCLQCEEEITIGQCMVIKKNVEFYPLSLMGYTSIPICKDCRYAWPPLKKITKTTAKRQYSLNDKELDDIRHIETTNPHYASSSPMKLYFVSEVELAAMAKFKVANRNELYALMNQRLEKRVTRTEQMRRNKLLSKDERKNELKVELKKHGLKLRRDSQIAELYINNSKRGFTLAESVRLIRRAHIVYQHVGHYFKRLTDEAYRTLNQEYRQHRVHESWDDEWRESKFDAEDKALQFFAEAKKSETVTATGKCQCGEPLYEADDLEKFQKELQEKSLKTSEKRKQKKK